MKKVLTLLLVITSLAAFSQGVKKQPKPEPEQSKQSVQPTTDTVAKGVFVNDTAKVIVTLLVEDGSKAWFKGFLVTKYFLPHGFASPATQQELYDEKKNLVQFRKDDIDQIRQVNWN